MIGIVVERFANGAGGFLPRLLRQPEERLAADMRRGIMLGQIDQLIDRCRFLRLRDGEDRFLAQTLKEVDFP